MTLHNYRSRQVHETLNGVNPSSSFRDMRSAKSGPNLWQIWQVFGPWASSYGANGHMTMTVHTYRPRQFHRTSNGENPSSGYRDMGSASLAAARPAARPPARTVTTISLQPGGLRGNKKFFGPLLHQVWLNWALTPEIWKKIWNTLLTHVAPKQDCSDQQASKLLLISHWWERPKGCADTAVTWCHSRFSRWQPLLLSRWPFSTEWFNTYSI